MVSISNAQSLRATDLLNIDQILGVAVFNSGGLPADSFITPQHKDIAWIQLAFQSLGLQQLLISEMQLPQLDHVMIRTKVGNIVIVRSATDGYIALLIKRLLPQERPSIDSDLAAWIADFEANIVRHHSNFKAV